MSVYLAILDYSEVNEYIFLKFLWYSTKFDQFDEEISDQQLLEFDFDWLYANTYENNSGSNNQSSNENLENETDQQIKHDFFDVPDPDDLMETSTQFTQTIKDDDQMALDFQWLGQNTDLNDTSNLKWHSSLNMIKIQQISINDDNSSKSNEIAPYI